MKSAGGLLMALGVILVAVAFGMDTTVYSPSSSIGTEYIPGSRTHNLGLLQSQMMLLQTGLAAFISGTFLCASGTGRVLSNGPAEGIRDRRENETDEQRESRLAGVRLINKIMMAIILLLIIGVPLALMFAS